MQKQITFLLFLSGLLLWGCDKPEPIPSYLRMEPFTVEASAGGDNLHEVTEGWLYVNNELYGGFHLPAEVPLLIEGSAEVQIFPGIKMNGLKSSPGVYPMFDRYKATVTLTPGEVAAVSPTTKYQAEAKFAFPLEKTSFDGSSAIFFDNRDFDTENTFLVNDTSGFQGKGILMQVDTPHTIMEIATELVPLPNTGDRNVWLEMQYSNTIPFSLQIIGVDNTGFEEAIPLYLFNSTNGAWNKIYLNLTDYLADKKRPNYRLFYRLPLPIENGQYSALKGWVKLDNVRLIHY
jgi:hypothetical protein